MPQDTESAPKGARKAKMEKLSIELSCGLCSESHEFKVEVPVGWKTRYGSVSEENAFCPKHSIIEKFASNCTGCVGDWGDCDLWRSFAYSGRRNLTENDFKIMRSGLCPKRTNGTMLFSQEEGMKQIDLSDSAPSESGIALEKAIREYLEKYPDKESGIV